MYVKGGSAFISSYRVSFVGKAARKPFFFFSWVRIRTLLPVLVTRPCKIKSEVKPPLSNFDSLEAGCISCLTSLYKSRHPVPCMGT